jgi:hypothetical protein
MQELAFYSVLGNKYLMLFSGVIRSVVSDVSGQMLREMTWSFGIGS